MRRAHVVLILLSAAALFALLFFPGNSDAPGNGEGPGGGVAPNAPGELNQAVGRAEGVAGDAQWELGATTGRVHGFDPEAVRRHGKFAESFLRDRGESAYNLLAVFAATGLRTDLIRALERYPNDPAVLYVVCRNLPDGEQRSAAIERFKLAAPNNPIPYLFSAADLFEKKRPEAIAELKAAIDRPEFYNYLHERAAAVRELALYAGESAERAEAAGLFALWLPELDAAMMASRHLQSVVKEQDPSGAEAKANARLLYDLSRVFQTPVATRMFMGHRVALSMEKLALQTAAALPENPLPIDPQPRLTQLAEMTKEAEFLAGYLNPQEVPSSLWDEYLRKIRLEGDLVALRWLARERQIKPAGHAF